MAISSLPIEGARTVQDALSEGIELHRAGRVSEAERLYRWVLTTDTRNAAALHLLGLVAQQMGDLRSAAKRMQAAIEIDTDQATYRSNLGNVLQIQGRFEEAVGEYERADQLRPDHAPTLSNLGMALQSLRRLDEAEAKLRRAALLMPDSAQVQDNLGNVLQAAGRMEEAFACHERALRLNPGNAETYGNLGLAQLGLGRWTAAMDSFGRALAISPGDSRIGLARAQLQLLLSDFEHGLRNFEVRKQVHGARKPGGREWGGESGLIVGASFGVSSGAADSLLLYGEQGLGDTVQFLRYLPQVRDVFAGDVILEVQEPLLRLAGELPGIRVVVRAGELPPSFAWHCSLMSLPWVLGGSRAPWETAAGSVGLAPSVPYLTVPEAAGRKADAALGTSTGLRVGLVWAGNPMHVRDRFRSIPLSQFNPLLGVETQGVRFYSLQLGRAKADLQMPEPRLIDLSDAIEDMADTAALIERLDLVIGVDTAVVHLAGALGKPVWTLLPFSPDWRWGLEREDCPWYPTMRLFRQPRPGDWESVVERVGAALREEIQKSGWG